MKKIIGYVGVDSGQLMICDPCYIDSEWKKEEFTDIRRYQHKDGTVLQYKVDFPHFEAVIPKYGKTMNQINSDGEAVEMPQVEAKHNFSYNACCKATLGEEGHGELSFSTGVSGVAVASRTAFGDGVYPVVATYDKNGDLKSLTVQFF